VGDLDSEFETLVLVCIAACDKLDPDNAENVSDAAWYQAQQDAAEAWDAICDERFHCFDGTPRHLEALDAVRRSFY
jgi:hypothetical protein